MKLKGIDFAFSNMNAVDLDRLALATEHQKAASAAEQKRVAEQKSDMADIVRGQCRIVMEFLDELLGDGAAEKLGLDGNDLDACAAVMRELKAACMEESERITRYMVESGR